MTSTAENTAPATADVCDDCGEPIDSIGACHPFCLAWQAEPAPAPDEIVAAFAEFRSEPEIRWTNGVLLRLPRATSPEYFAALATYDDYDEVRDRR